MTRAADLAKLIAGGGTITVDDNSTNITLKSTDADSNLGPILDLLRDGGSPADSDFIGQVRFQAKDDGGNIHEYAKIFGQIADVTGGTEDGILNIRTVLGGTDTRRIDLGVTETVFNEDSADVDFRIESDGNANALIVDAGHSTVGINTAAVSNRTLKIEGEGNLGAILSLNESTRGGLVEFSAGSGTELYIGSELGILGSGNNNELLIHTGVSALKIDRSGNSTFANTVTLSDGNVVLADGHGIDFSSTSDAGGMANELLDDYEEGTWTPFFGGSSGDPTVSSYATANGKYTKIGNKVYANFVCIASGTPSGGSGDLLIAGLPFALNATNTQATGYLGIVNNITNNMSTSQLMLVGQSTSTNINVMNCAGTSTTGTNNLGVDKCHNSGARIDGTFIYTVTA